MHVNSRAKGRAMKGNTEKREPKSRGCGQNLRAESASRRSRAKGRALKMKHKKIRVEGQRSRAKFAGQRSRSKGRPCKRKHKKRRAEGQRSWAESAGRSSRGEGRAFKRKYKERKPKAEYRVPKAAHSKGNTKRKNQKVVQVNPLTEGRALKGNRKRRGVHKRIFSK